MVKKITEGVWLVNIWPWTERFAHIINIMIKYLKYIYFKRVELVILIKYTNSLLKSIILY